MQLRRRRGGHTNKRQTKKQHNTKHPLNPLLSIFDSNPNHPGMAEPNPTSDTKNVVERSDRRRHVERIVERKIKINRKTEQRQERKKYKTR
jgi:hypothetical protein